MVTYRLVIILSLGLFVAPLSTVACDEEESICEGNRVYFDEKVGVVTKVRSDGYAFIDVEGQITHSFKHVSELFKPVDCDIDTGICTGNQIYVNDEKWREGNVLEVYSDGTAYIDIKNFSGHRYRHVSELSKSVECDIDTDICTGNRVYLNEGWRGGHFGTLLRRHRLY